MNNLVVYVRHAESESNVVIHRKADRLAELSASESDELHSYADPRITEVGASAAVVTAKHLFEKLALMGRTKITVWVSPYRRAVETAQPFIDLLNKNNIAFQSSVRYDLQEYTTPKKPLSDEMIASGFVVDLNEKSFINRVIAFNELHLKYEMASQTRGHESSALIIFGHSLFFSCLLSHHIHHEKITFDTFPSLQLPNCSISCETMCDGVLWKTFMIGGTGHLPNTLVTGNHVML
jgi:broad specificity phosphatase PhoE